MDNGTVDAGKFRSLLSERAAPLARVALAVASGKVCLDHPLLCVLLAESDQLEAVLDLYGAAHNRDWHTFRMRTAAVRNFSDAACQLLTLEHYAAMGHRSADLPDTFLAETQEAQNCLQFILRCALRYWREEALHLGLEFGNASIEGTLVRLALPEGVLAPDHEVQRDLSPEEQVVHLATLSLETGADVRMLQSIREHPPTDWGALMPDPVCEESLGHIHNRFHMLQSLYDTYVSNTQTEIVDRDLRTLRRLVQTLARLTRVACLLVHFQERHADTHEDDPFVSCPECPIGGEIYLQLLFGYCLGHAADLCQAVRAVAQRILAHHAKTGTIAVRVPRYHGFHVRPSTMISQIVKHYGSAVSMKLAGMEYDASSVMALIRANEYIQSEKRNAVGKMVAGTDLEVCTQGISDRRAAVRRVLSILEEKGALIVHQHKLPLDELPIDEDANLAEVVLDVVARLLAARHIDIPFELEVEFTGDHRVLKDIQILAEHDYGEDSMGRNIPLPSTLDYLHRK
ncbi:MAG: HPr family phosphocarrier protein [Lentisphaeria bacterium]|nr:HPr family phosphocarrier protein [Lentisphaeria bacterium]